MKAHDKLSSLKDYQLALFSRAVFDVPPRTRRLLVIAGVGGIVILTMECLVGRQDHTVPLDKIIHFSGYCVLSLTFVLALRPILFVPGLVGLVLMGIAIEFVQRSTLYDLDGKKDKIGPGDLSLFAPCWMDTGSEDCEFTDFDCDGMTGPGDLAFFATAWLTNLSQAAAQGGIVLPLCKSACNGSISAEDGDLPWAGRDMVNNFGLTYPPRDWAGWRLSPESYEPEQGVKGRRSSRSRK